MIQFCLSCENWKNRILCRNNCQWATQEATGPTWKQTICDAVVWFAFLMEPRTVAPIVIGLVRRGDDGTTKIVNILHEKDENLCWASFPHSKMFCKCISCISLGRWNSSLGVKCVSFTDDSERKPAYRFNGSHSRFLCRRCKLGNRGSSYARCERRKSSTCNRYAHHSSHPDARYINVYLNESEYLRVCHNHNAPSMWTMQCSSKHVDCSSQQKHHSCFFGTILRWCISAVAVASWHVQSAYMPTDGDGAEVQLSLFLANF